MRRTQPITKGQGQDVGIAHCTTYSERVPKKQGQRSEEIDKQESGKLTNKATKKDR